MKFGVRVTFLGLLFTALFSVLFIRMWFVQVAQGQVFAETAAEQIIRIDYFTAPRGDVEDRNGVKLATSTSELVVVVDRSEIEASQEEEVIQRLAAVLDVSPIEVRSEFEAADPASIVVLDDHAVTAGVAYTILEQSIELPGVTVEAVPVRAYLRGENMAHVLGHIGLPDPADLEENPSLLPNTVVGKMGVEREYDQFLQGTEGTAAFRVNAQGDILQTREQVDPQAGGTVRLTLDLALQQTVEDVLRQVVVLANRLKAADEDVTLPAQRAAAVVMDPRNGEVLALASYPSFEPQAFVGGIERNEFDRLSDNFAFNNLTIQGLKPPASTFKAVTYVTALEENVFPEGVFNAESPIECSAELQALELADDASQLVYRNWTRASDGLQNLHRAFERSCNIYFWEVALSIWRQFKNTDNEDILQDWAFELGIGRPTQVDLPFESSGILPDRELFDRWRDEQPWRVRAEGWLGGDLMNIAVGQGDILVTPVQMATAYSSMVNGGTVYQPRVASEVVGPDGSTVRELAPRPIRDAGLSPATVASLRRDMEAVVSVGTAQQAFADSGLVGRVGGKTGTAQGFTDDEGRLHDSTAWFVGAAPIDSPRYVVVVMVDEGGSGGSVAAPAARAIFQHLLGETVTELKPGEDTD